MCGKQDQVMNEIIPIRRHLIAYKDNQVKSFSVFIAPVIHTDAIEAAAWYKEKDNLDIITLSIAEFISVIQCSTHVTNFLS